MVKKVEIRKEFLDQEIEKLAPKILKALKMETYGMWLLGKYFFELTSKCGNDNEIGYVHKQLSLKFGLTEGTIKIYKTFYTHFPNLYKFFEQYPNIPTEFFYILSKHGCGEDDVKNFLKKNENIVKDNNKITVRELVKAVREEGLISGKYVPKIYCEICGFEVPEEQKKNVKIIEELFEKGWRINPGVLPLEHDKVNCEWRYHAICDNCWNTIVIEKAQLLEKMANILEMREALKKKIESLRKFMFSHGLMAVFDEEDLKS